MSVLLQTGNNLTSDEIMWAASHLPDTEQQGSYDQQNDQYDHSEENVFKALCITKKQAQQVAEVLGTATTKLIVKSGSEKYKMSNAVQEVIEKGNKIPAFQKLLVAKMIQEALQQMAQIKGFMNDDGDDDE